MKKILVFLAILSIVVCSSLICISASDEFTLIDGGELSEGVTWELYTDPATELNTLEISGEGDMPDVEILEECPWYSYRNEINYIVINEGITSIGKWSFFDLEALIGITLPDGLSVISDYAFFITGISTTIDIPDSVTTIGDYAFHGNHYFESLNLGSGLKYIGNGAFSESHKLIGVEFPSSLESIGDQAFRECYAIKEIVIPDSVTFLGEAAFLRCNKLQSVTMGKGVTSLSNTLFQECYALTYANLGVSIQNIGHDAFNNCIALKTVILSEGLESIGENAFYGCYSLSDISIPDTVTSIGSNAFYGCGTLAEINLPDGVTVIENETFYGCESLVTVTLGNGVTSIGAHAFEKCYILENISLPDSVRAIGGQAFFDCWALPSVNIPNGVESIGGLTFMGCESLSSVTIPDSVSSIGQGAFWGCVNIESIIIPDKVEAIDFLTFGGCKSLTSIVVPTSVTSINSRAFEDCSTELTFYTPAGSVAETFAIEKGFKVVNGLPGDEGTDAPDPDEGENIDPEDDIVIASGVLAGDYMRVKWTLYKGGTLYHDSLVINDGWNQLGYRDDAWDAAHPEYIEALSEAKHIVLVGIKKLGTGAFRNALNLESVEMGEDCDQICGGVFENCPKLKTVYLTGHEYEEGTVDFSNLYSMENNAYPYFSNCLIKKINLSSERLTANLPSNFAKDCTELTQISFENVSAIADDAFNGCSSLSTIIGHSGSVAQTFATSNALNFISLDGGGDVELPGGYVQRTDAGLTVTLNKATGEVTVVPSDANDGSSTVVDLHSFIWAPAGETSFFNKYKDIITSVTISNSSTVFFTEIKGSLTGFPELETFIFPRTVTTLTGYYSCYGNNPKLATWGPAGTPTGTCNLSTMNGGKFQFVDAGYYYEEIGASGMFNSTAFSDIIFGNHGISRYMFKNCDNLTEVDLTGTGQVNASAFADCDNLVKVTFSNSDQFYGAQNGAYTNAKLYIPEGTEAYTKIVEAGILNASGVAYEYELITAWTLHTGLNYKYRYEGTTAYITIVDGDQSGELKLDVYPFDDKGIQNDIRTGKNVTKVIIVNNPSAAPITTLNGGFGDYGGNIATVVVPDSVNYITRGGGYFFAKAPLTTFGPEGTPEGTCDLSKIKYADNNDGRYLFRAANFTKVIISEGQISVQTQAFKNSTNLTELYLPSTMKDVWGDSFTYCTNADLKVYVGAPEGLLTIHSGSIPSSATVIYLNIETVAEAVGFTVRTKDYAGLRGIFKVDLTAKNEGLELVEFGAVAGAESKFTGGASTVTPDADGVSKQIIWSESSGWEGSVITYEPGVSVEFAYTVTYKTENEKNAYGNLGLYMRAYQIWENKTTGARYYVYTDYEDGKSVSLADAAALAYVLAPEKYEDSVCWSVIEEHKISSSATVDGTNISYYEIDAGDAGSFLVYRGNGTLSMPNFQVLVGKSAIILQSVDGTLTYSDVFNQLGIPLKIDGAILG